ncbi:MAG: YgiT-type zinc finger protein [Pseudobdellovibrionaceae bacterium]|nr:YgiT-type zinc finger protein [Bdellovibrionales bacterium]USN47245.1 MAG: YgiT-type zinc finger protein [Pseudobdellovibrionaceae bacterium]
MTLPNVQEIPSREHVHGRVCGNCGEEYISEEVLENLFKASRRASFRHVPVW